MSGRAAVFLDRDGVINANRTDHVKSWEEFEFLPRSLEALRRLAEAGWPVIVTTNQAAINRGLVNDETVRGIHVRMQGEIERAGGSLERVYFCPHRPEEGCACRKPQPGMYLQAAREHDLDLKKSYVVGDTLRDVEAAQTVGAQPILVLCGLAGQEQLKLLRENGSACVVVDDLMAAVEWIEQAQGQRPCPDDRAAARRDGNRPAQ